MIKILLSLDSSEKTMARAVMEAREKKAFLTGLFVLDATWNDYIGHDWLSGSNARAGFLDYVKNEELGEAERTIRQFEACAAGVSHAVKVAPGRVPEEICRELTNGYDFLVISYPFRRGLEHMRNPLPKILKACDCAVLLVK